MTTINSGLEVVFRNFAPATHIYISLYSSILSSNSLQESHSMVQTPFLESSPMLSLYRNAGYFSPISFSFGHQSGREYNLFANFT